MKKIITIALFFLPFFGFSQTVKVDTLKTKPVVVKVVNNNEQELDEEYTERPFQGKEEVLKVTPYTGLTDHEEYNLRLKKKGQPKVVNK
jgi:hypothetical protein